MIPCYASQVPNDPDDPDAPILPQADHLAVSASGQCLALTFACPSAHPHPVTAAYLLLAIAPLVNGLVAAAAPLLGPVAEPTPPVSPSAPFQALPPSVLVGCDVMYGSSGVVL
ncbi:hypothetical protein B0H15DRAFT_1024574 [Mycena belliarum]|uniref:Uncharacterized protein n=1 Tax=Mycena belliarum TaxID=1033014 RepID=A0AAD6XMV6_9AGAR|nr:hypothetical protein B0H15DRAFT_1024574 [Mycena belliae]